MNPYQPPASTTSEQVPVSRVRYLANLVPATLAVGLTLLLWVVLVSTLDELVGYRFSMVMWAFTLYLSSLISVFTVNRIWQTRTYPLAFGLAFAVFSFVFLAAEGDTSNGTDYWIMSIIYGTLLSLPVATFYFARWTTGKLDSIQQSPTDESTSGI